MTDHKLIASDYRAAGLWNEARGYVAAADEYMKLANLHKALAAIYAQPVPPSSGALNIPIDVDV